MAKIDPVAERARLARLYAGMSEGELEKIALEQGSLTEIAKEALLTEMKRRGMRIEQSQSQGTAGGEKTKSEEVAENTLRAEGPVASEAMSGEFTDDELEPVTLRKFRDIPQAMVAKSILDSAGIECFLGDENTVRMDWLWSNLLGGVKLWVRQGDFAAATELLKQDFSDGFEMGGAGEYKPPKCPYCKSPDISFEELNRAVAHPGLMLGIPIPMNRVGWLCHACGKTWSDDENHSAPSAS